LQNSNQSSPWIQIYNPEFNSNGYLNDLVINPYKLNGNEKEYTMSKE